MNIVHPLDLSTLQAAIVAATHGITDAQGQRVMIGTIDDRRLATAALVAIQIALGDVVWPGDKKIVLPRRAEFAGPFVEELR